MTTPTLCMRSPMTWMKAARTLMFSSEPCCFFFLCQNFRFWPCPLPHPLSSSSLCCLLSSSDWFFFLLLWEWPWPCPWLWGCSTMHILVVCVWGGGGGERERERSMTVAMKSLLKLTRHWQRLQYMLLLAWCQHRFFLDGLLSALPHKTGLLWLPR